MLPIIPALLLLLLQGPANIERMASEGRLPAALDAMHRHMAKPTQSQVRPTENVVLASLLAVSNDREMSQFLWQMLSIAEPTDPVVSIPVEPEAVAPIECPPRLGDISEGFFASGRTRDGPR